MQLKDYKIVVKKLTEYSDAYCSNAEPLVSDAEYDATYLEAANYEAKHSNFIDLSSPSQNISKMKEGTLKEVLHCNPVAIPTEVINTNGMNAFWKSLDGWRDELGKSSVNNLYCSHYLSGVIVELLYKKGELIGGILSVNGKETGENISDTVINVSNIPSRINENGSISVWGVVTIHTADLATVNKTREELNIAPFKDAEELCYHALRHRDKSISKKYDMRFYAYGMFSKAGTASTVAQNESLTQLGFCIPRFTNCYTVGEVVSFIHETSDIRDTLPTTLKGVLIRLSDVALKSFEAPAALWKFVANNASTRVRKIEWRVLQSGKVEPFAIIDMVVVDGIPINEIALHTAASVKELHVGAGAEVVVARMSGRIPYISQVIKQGRYEEPPTACPSCGEPLTISEKGMYCTNLDCPEMLVSKLEFIFSPAVLGMKNIDSEFIREAVKTKSINSLREIFLPMISNSRKVKQEYLDAITRRAQQLNLMEAYLMLGIPYMGRAIATRLVMETGSLDGFYQLLTDKQTMEEALLTSYMKDSLRQWYSIKSHRDFLDYIKSLKLERLNADGRGI